MSWGTFKVYTANRTLTEVHVAPCNDERVLLEGHTLSCFCDCDPRIDAYHRDGNVIVYVHNHMH